MNTSDPLPQFDSKIPPSLLDLEKWMGEIIVKPLKNQDSLNLPIYDAEITAEIEQRISSGAHLSPAQSIGIYNQQYWFRFFTLAQENFPTLVRLFGYADFNQLIAKPSILKYPADHWAIFSATANLPRWIEKDYEGEDKTFLMQIAQIDALYHNFFYLPSDNAAQTSKSFVHCLKLDGDLLKFRDKLLEEPIEYWMENPFPEIDFSRPYFISFFQSKNDLIYKEISEEEFLCFKLAVR